MNFGLMFSIPVPYSMLNMHHIPELGKKNLFNLKEKTPDKKVIEGIDDKLETVKSLMFYLMDLKSSLCLNLTFYQGLHQPC